MNYLTILQDIEEAFFQCSVCMCPLPSPMMLSCYHPYCLDCLRDVLLASDSALVCPVCERNCDIPDNGLEGFSPEPRLEYTYQSIQIHKSFIIEDTGRCAGCEDMKAIVAYCYYCKCFLCPDCYQTHLKSKMFLDHRAHIINLKNVNAKNVTLEKLAILCEGHRCHKHRHMDQRMMCHGCGSQPVCSHEEAHKIIAAKRAQRESKQDEQTCNHRVDKPRHPKSSRKAARHRARSSGLDNKEEEEEDKMPVDLKIEERLKESEIPEETKRNFDEEKRALWERRARIEKELAELGHVVTNGDVSDDTGASE